MVQQLRRFTALAGNWSSFPASPSGGTHIHMANNKIIFKNLIKGKEIE